MYIIFVDLGDLADISCNKVQGVKKRKKRHKMYHKPSITTQNSKYKNTEVLKYFGGTLKCYRHSSLPSVPQSFPTASGICFQIEISSEVARAEAVVV